MAGRAVRPMIDPGGDVCPMGKKPLLIIAVYPDQEWWNGPETGQFEVTLVIRCPSRARSIGWRGIPIYAFPLFPPATRPGAATASARIQERPGLAARSFRLNMILVDTPAMLRTCIERQAVAILRSWYRAMAPGARLWIVEQVIQAGDADDRAKLLDLLRLVLLGARERTADEYQVLVEAVGFAEVAIHPTDTPFSVIEAIRPEPPHVSMSEPGNTQDGQPMPTITIEHRRLADAGLFRAIVAELRSPAEYASTVEAIIDRAAERLMWRR